MPIDYPATSTSKHPYIETKVRLRLDPAVLFDSLQESIKTIGEERANAYKSYKQCLDQLHTELAYPYEAPEHHIALPVPFLPTRNVGLLAGLDWERDRYEALNEEYFAYVRYLEFIKSEDRPLEITVDKTVFYQSKEEVSEFFDLSDEDDEEEDVFLAANQRQRELLAEAALKAEELEDDNE